MVPFFVVFVADLGRHDTDKTGRCKHFFSFQGRLAVDMQAHYVDEQVCMLVFGV
jgi:hypothetical protein